MAQRHRQLSKGKAQVMPFVLTPGPLLGPPGSVIGTVIHADLAGIFTFLSSIQFTHNPWQVCLLNLISQRNRFNSLPLHQADSLAQLRPSNV